VPGTTSRLGLDYALGSDNVSAYPTADLQAKTILDTSVTVTEGVFASRPSGSYYGQTYYATDVALWYFWTGSAWQTVFFQGASPLATVSTSSNLTLTAGQFVTTTGSSGVTITLPSPSTVALVGICNEIGGGAATSVDGTNINGQGLNDASSFEIGTYGTTVVLLSDGTSWRIVAGEQNTGWVPLTPPANWNGSPSGYYTAAYQRAGNSIRLRGGVENSTGSTQTGPGLTIATGAPPPAEQVLGMLVSPSSSTIGLITTGGAVQVNAGGVANGTIVSLDGIQYDLT